jgi:hypothetical protein
MNATMESPMPTPPMPELRSAADVVAGLRAMSPDRHVQVTIEIVAALYQAFRDLQLRVAALEAAPAPLTFGGPWLAGTAYQRNTLVQRANALWLAQADLTEDVPGQTPAWRRLAGGG